MDRKPFRILAVAGSVRQGSYNQGLLRAAQELAPDWVELQFFDIGQLPFFNQDVGGNKMHCLRWRVGQGLCLLLKLPVSAGA